MPFRAGAPFLHSNLWFMAITQHVSMPSRASASFLHLWLQRCKSTSSNVSMPFRAKAPFLRVHGQGGQIWIFLQYQCPLGLVLHFYTDGSNYIRQLKGKVSMPFRACASFLRYPLENLGFMRFLEPVFAGIYQNILAMTIFVYVNNLDIFNCH